MTQDFDTHKPEILYIVEFESSDETDHTQSDMSLITGSVRYAVLWPDGTTEILSTGLRPKDNFGWSHVVVNALQEWRDAGGVIPEWTPPTIDEIRAQMPTLSGRQFRKGLLYSGTKTAEVDAFIDAIEDEFEREDARIDWEHAAEFERLHPLVVRWGEALDYSPELIDELWEFYKTI